jgi:3'-5' exonuclease
LALEEETKDMSIWINKQGKRRVYIDIETIPPDEAVSAEVETIVDERFRKLALSGERGRVMAIGIIIELGDIELERRVLGYDPATECLAINESRTLREFWDAMADFNPTRDLIVGHNIFDFDLLFIYKRSIILGVKPSLSLSFVRYRSQPVYDTMREWAKWGTQRIALAELAEVLGLKSSKNDGIDGSCVYDHFLIGSHKDIADYCMRDVELTRQIFCRMNFVEPNVNRNILNAISATAT